jgi:hypothetical protein
MVLFINMAVSDLTYTPLPSLLAIKLLVIIKFEGRFSPGSPIYNPPPNVDV